MVECMTDNRNRTVAGVRHAFSKAAVHWVLMAQWPSVYQKVLSLLPTLMKMH